MGGVFILDRLIMWDWNWLHLKIIGPGSKGVGYILLMGLILVWIKLIFMEIKQVHKEGGLILLSLKILVLFKANLRKILWRMGMEEGFPLVWVVRIYILMRLIFYKICVVWVGEGCMGISCWDLKWQILNFTIIKDFKKDLGFICWKERI